VFWAIVSADEADRKIPTAVFAEATPTNLPATWAALDQVGYKASCAEAMAEYGTLDEQFLSGWTPTLS
jgi:hypothetical protein